MRLHKNREDWKYPQNKKGIIQSNKNILGARGC